jgi:hypothetical protein
VSHIHVLYMCFDDKNKIKNGEIVDNWCQIHVFIHIFIITIKTWIIDILG